MRIGIDGRELCGKPTGVGRHLAPLEHGRGGEPAVLGRLQRLHLADSARHHRAGEEEPRGAVVRKAGDQRFELEPRLAESLLPVKRQRGCVTFGP